PANSAAAPPAGAATTPPANPGAEAVKPEGVRGDEYQIGEGDVLWISVWGEAAASVPAATVRTDGKISMPLIKDVTVAGITPAAAEILIRERLSKLIREP